MDINKIKDEQFEEMLRLAVNECFEKEMAAIPPQEELEQMYPYSKKDKRRMKKMFVRDQRTGAFRIILKYSYRVATVFAITLTMLFGALLTDENVRAAVKETVVEWFNTFTRFKFEGKNNANLVSGWHLEYLPDGFTESKSFNLGFGKTIIYTNAQSENLVFTYVPSSDTSIAVNSERADYETFYIEETEYYLFIPQSKELPAIMIWEQGSFAFSLEASLNGDELKAIAVSVVSN